MPRPKKIFANPKAQKAHEESLRKRRERHREKQTIKMASQAAEGEADFAALVEAEKQRQETLQQTKSRKGGEASPKVITQARDDMAMAFDLMGGVPALVVWGRANPTEFYRIWARLIPRPAEAASTALPLESLLEKLATKAEMSVRDAAQEVGYELIEQGRKQAELEDKERTLN